MELGFALSSEDHSPNELVRQAQIAERAGFTFGLISDHFHPWVSEQGHSPFVWSTLGGIAQATETIRMGTGVTCPLIRIHPAIVAQAAATVAAMMPGRFFLGVGTGENLNEHVLGDRWPPPDERLEMLEEAVEVMRLLWEGGYQTHRGRHYTVEHTRIFDLPDERIEVAAEATDGWLYLVTLTGTTGARTEHSPALAGLVERARRATKVPLYAGFGISTPDHAQAAAELADGIVVGSRAVEIADEGPEALRGYVASLRAALD